jgi:glycine/sarcosine N-methyltransferase
MKKLKNQFDSKVALNWDELINWDKRFKSERNFISKILKKNFCNTVLDVATGSGFDSVLLYRHGFNVTSIDNSIDMLAAAKKNFKIYKIKSNIKLMDWKNLNKINKKFDAIVCLGNSLACELNEKLRFKAIHNFSRVLKKNGIAIIDHRNYEKYKKKINKKKNFYYLNSKVKISSKIIKHRNKKITLFKYALNSKNNFFLKMFPVQLNYIYQVFKTNNFELIKTYKDRKINCKNPSFYLHVFKKK